MTIESIISIVAPVYNEAGNIPTLHRRVVEVMGQLGEPWELVMVNDGSRDGSIQELREVAEADPHVRVVNFARNFGHASAVTAGMMYARGQAVVVIDADLQDPPEVILQLVAKWREGFEVVYAVRSERKGETWFKKFTAKMFYRVIYRIAEIDIPVDTGDFRLMDRRVVDALKTMPEHNRFIRGMTSWVGFNQTGVEYVREARTVGETKYPFRKMLRFALDAITGFSYFPLQITIYASLILGLIAVVAVPVVAVLRLATGAEVFEGQATTLIVVLLLSSFQLFFFFVMGQYIARIYDEVRQRPLYIVSNVWEQGAADSVLPSSPGSTS